MSLRIDGKKISSDIKEELKEQVKLLKEEGISVCLAVIQVGNDPASSVYVNNKKKACAYVGINSRSYELPEDTSEQTLLDLVQKLNEDPEVNGILVQLPLPKQGIWCLQRCIRAVLFWQYRVCWIFLRRKNSSKCVRSLQKIYRLL